MLAIIRQYDEHNKRARAPTQKRAEGRAPVWGSESCFCVHGLWSSCYPRPRLIHKALDRRAQAVLRGGACCASQVLDRGAQADARGATRILDRFVKAAARGATRCALHVTAAAVLYGEC